MISKLLSIIYIICVIIPLSIITSLGIFIQFIFTKENRFDVPKKSTYTSKYDEKGRKRNV